MQNINNIKNIYNKSVFRLVFIVILDSIFRLYFYFLILLYIENIIIYKESKNEKIIK